MGKEDEKIRIDIMDQENEYKAWLAYSKMDYDCAVYLNDAPMHPRPLNIICYHCQQAAEKAIKAVIVANGAPGGLPRLHDLAFLLNQLKNIADIDDKYYEYADTLTPYGTSIRYPSELFLEDRHAVTALNYATEILNWAKALCAKQSDQQEA